MKTFREYLIEQHGDWRGVGKIGLLTLVAIVGFFMWSTFFKSNEMKVKDIFKLYPTYTSYITSNEDPRETDRLISQIETIAKQYGYKSIKDLQKASDDVKLIILDTAISARNASRLGDSAMDEKKYHEQLEKENKAAEALKKEQETSKKMRETNDKQLKDIANIK